MTKDEMKNKISMALKDPILQQGFEIICKENVELKRDKQNLRADLRTARNNLQAKDTVYQLAMEELNYAKSHCLFHSDCPTQKENAELKADNDARKFAMAMSEKVEKQLREKNAELKKKIENLHGKQSNLEAENEKLKLQLKNFEENVTRIITNFWMWYVSVNHKRDLSAKEEGEKYANNFFHDLIQEANEIKE